MKQTLRQRLAGLTHAQLHFLNESFTSIAYTRALKIGDVALDIGANAGDHTRTMAAIVGETGLVHAFEPNIIHYGALSSIQYCRLWPFAASDTLEQLTLNIPPDHGWASLRDLGDYFPQRDIHQLTVVSVCIDDLSEIQAERVRFIKIDVEGSEERVFRGLQRLLKFSKPDLVIENVTPQIVESALKLGYRVAAFDGSDWSPLGHPLVNSVVSLNPDSLIPSEEEFFECVEKVLREDKL